MLASHLDLGRLLACLSHGAQCEGTCLEVVGRPPTDPLPPGGSRYAAFCTRCCPPGAAQSCPLPSPPAPLCQPGASISALKTCLGICHGPTAIKLDQQPLYLPPLCRGANAATAGSRKQWSSSQALRQQSLLLATGKPGQLLNSPPSSNSPFC